MEYPWRSVHTRILCNLREVLAKHFREDSAKWIWCFWQKKVMPTWANGIRNSAIKDRQNTENQRRNSFECWIFWVKKNCFGNPFSLFFLLPAVLIFADLRDFSRSEAGIFTRHCRFFIHNYEIKFRQYKILFCTYEFLCSYVRKIFLYVRTYHQY